MPLLTAVTVVTVGTVEVVPLVIDPLSTDLHSVDTLVVMAVPLVVVVVLLVVDPPVLTPDLPLHIPPPALVSLLL